ncbi:MAG: hypothetical protein EON91_06660 [Brevundimonas sp.]|uniref:hypothetical protein n=1 Tax=Brevundimonas sp. TaxID=1871086 RepID=UPI0011F99631|nr:hypothetical protein [Brevundimonas sp.]RZJ18103.1 MAG: hypothetical protein EON91_06660 [Brevundimonas sp.]
MPRVTIDFYDSRQDAISALVSLREVGLSTEDIASAWLAPREGEYMGDDAQPPASLYEAGIDGVGRVQFTGWLGEVALASLGADSIIDLAKAMGSEEPDTDRIHRTLASGGGLIAVRARDTYSPQDD